MPQTNPRHDIYRAKTWVIALFVYGPGIFLAGADAGVTVDLPGLPAPASRSAQSATNIFLLTE